MIQLRQLSERTLNCVASLVARQSVRVIRSTRLKSPLVVAASSWTVMLDSDRAGLGDLFLGAVLLRRRAEIRERIGNGNSVSKRLLSRWVKSSWTELLNEYGGLRTLQGHCIPPHGVSPQIVWDKIPLRQLDAEDVAFDPQLLAAPGVEFQGGGDWKAIRLALLRGSLPLSSAPGLEPPVVSFPLRQSVAEAEPVEMERLETEMREMADTQRKIMQCFRRKAESRARDPSLRELRRSGKNLDLTRLPQAYIASRTGTPARLFRRTVEGRQPIFDPSRHVVLYAFDINSLVSAGPGQPAWNRRAIAITASVFKQLDVPIVMIAFADRLVRVANKQYYLHVTTRIKSLDEPWGYGVWNRLIHSCRPKAWNLPGKPAAYHPLQMQTLASELETIDLQDDFVNRTVMYTSVRGMPPVKPFRSPEFLQLTAGHLDHQLKQLEVRYESDGIDLDFLYIPQDLKIQAPRGSRVAKMQTLS